MSLLQHLKKDGVVILDTNTCNEKIDLLLRDPNTDEKIQEYNIINKLEKRNHRIPPK